MQQNKRRAGVILSFGAIALDPGSDLCRTVSPSLPPSAKRAIIHFRHAIETIMQTISLDRAVAAIPDGASLMIGGFMAVGTAERIVDEIVRQGKKDLTVIANDTARPGVGIGKLVRARLLRKVIASHIGLNPETQQQMIAGDIEVELVPQGTLIER